MRSIGAWKKKALRKIVAEVMGQYIKGSVTGEDWNSVEAEIKGQIPSDWYDTWEDAWSEINRLVTDYMNDWRFS